MWGQIRDAVSTLYHYALNWRKLLDPLTLDLDGDGIETVGIDPNNPILFDHDGDGVKSATGWIHPDDGLLVLDRNANGVIDNGSELFGDSTVISDGQGGQRFALDGFEALTAEDTNADGRVDANDANFSNLRVWRDLNQDGISQSNELSTLTELGIATINTAKTENNTPLGNGTVIADLGTYIKTDGTTGTAGQTAKLGDVNFPTNSFYNQFPDTLPITAEAQLLPNMQGSGLARSLREAASTGSVEGNGLFNALGTFAAATTWQAQRSQLDGLLEAWANTVDHKNMFQRAWDAGWLVTFRFGSSGERAAADSEFQLAFEGSGGDPGNGGALLDAFAAFQSPGYIERLRRIEILEVFNGRNFMDFSGWATQPPPKLPDMQFTTQPDPETGGSGGVLLLRRTEVGWNNQVMDILTQSYEQLKQSVYDALVLQTRLKPYLDEIGLTIDADGALSLDYTPMQARLDANSQTNAVATAADLIDLARILGSSLDQSGFDVETQLATTLRSLPDTPERDEMFQAFGVQVGDAGSLWLSGRAGIEAFLDQNGTWASAASVGVIGTNRPNVLLGGAGDDLLAWENTNNGNDLLLGEAGNDTLYGAGGDDQLYGGTGNDTLWGGTGNDYLIGGEGNDYLAAGDGVDYLDGGAGNDNLLGGNGDDVYVFGRGFGNDTVSESGTTNGGAASNRDVILFKPDVLPADVNVRRNGFGNDLVLSILGTSDTLTVTNYFSNDGADESAVDEIRFADGTVWDYAAVKAMVLQGTEAGETLVGFAGDDAFGGAGGDDTLHGQAGNDTLDGGAGNDFVHGDAGDDVLDGGAGNDVLYGDAGNDVYRFGRGGGQDRIGNYDPDAAAVDTIEFAPDVLPADVTVRRSGNDVVLTINGTTDSLTVYNHFYNGGDNPYRIDLVRFADGTAWDFAAIAARSVGGTEAADTIYGGAGDDVIYSLGGNDTVYGYAGRDVIDGGAGNDNLNGGDGDDILDGGAGNDTLTGGAGNDIFRFGRGGGQDTVYVSDSTVGKLDAIEFAADVLPADVTASRVGDNLVLSINGTTDTLTVPAFFSNTASNYYVVEEIRFADGTVWGLATVRAMVLVATEGDDTLRGYATDDVISGAGGNDTLYGYAGNDILDGGTGNDRIDGGDGNDTLAGGDGNDVLWGYAGSDTLDGGSGADYLYGGNEADTLNGGDGADYLYGDAGDDVLDGGAGNDVLNGGTGNDVFRFGRGSGQDRINDYDYITGKLDAIEFAVDVFPADVTVKRSGDSLILGIVGTADTLTVSNYFYNDGGTAYGIEEVRFADGTMWDLGTVKALALVPTESADTLTGYATNDAINGAGGNDRLYGRAGNDTLDGGAGADTLYGEAGDDVLNGGADNDTLYAGDGNDVINGGDGADYLYGDAGNDTLDGGAGNDSLTGGTGNDTYRFGRGGGQDYVNSYDTTAGKQDRIAASINPLDLVFSRSGSNLELKIHGDTSTMMVLSWYGHSAYQTEVIQAADGSTLLNSQVDQLIQAMATFGANNSGLTWDQAIDQRPDEVQAVISAYWQPAA